MRSTTLTIAAVAALLAMNVTVAQDNHRQGWRSASYEDMKQHGGGHSGGCGWAHGPSGMSVCGQHRGGGQGHGGPSVPEPETWLMLMGGAGLVATQLRRKQKKLNGTKL